MLDYIPQDLKDLPQWCIAAANKAPLYLACDAQGNYSLQNASVTNPAHYTTFETAKHIYETWPDRTEVSGIGIVLRKENGLVCFDFDIKEDSFYSGPERKQYFVERFEALVERIDSYTEASRSGRGYHVWVRGNLPDTAKNNNRKKMIEQYDDARFMICTGNVRRDRPIMARPDAIQMMTLVVGERVHTAEEAIAAFETAPQELEDWELYEKACAAGNGSGDKFEALARGDWQNIFNPETSARLYPSQSEADSAFINLLAFYTDSNEQVLRMYAMSPLSDNPKEDGRPRDGAYVMRSLKKFRSEQQVKRQIRLDEIRRAAELLIQLETAPPEQATPVSTAGLQEPDYTPNIWPPGMCGQIAGFVYRNSARPIAEVSVTAALGLLSGIVGKTFCISNSGLNLYLILVARSAVGKEAIHTGISAFMHAIRSREPGAMQFIAPQDFASGPALTKALVAWPCFVNIAGEWGHKLKRIACDEKDGPMQQLRRVLTDLYQKSGPQSLAGGIAYSNKEKDVATVSGVAFSMVGETTPGTYYESMSGSMMEDGFLSRFTTVHFDGQRPPLNFDIEIEPPKELGDHVANLCSYVIQLLSEHKVVPVQMAPDAVELYRNFEEFCDKQINGTEDESIRQLWNRAALKTLRISAILAVADNWLQPVITRDQFLWARWLVMSDVQKTFSLMNDGVIGQGDNTRERLLLKTVREYITRGMDGGLGRSYKVDSRMPPLGIVPVRYLKRRLQQNRAFDGGNQRSSTRVIEDTLMSLIRSGIMCQVPEKSLYENFRTHGDHYQLIDLEGFMAQDER